MIPKSLTATSLRLLLTALLFVIIAVAVGITYFADRQLTQVATEVSHTVVDANASQNNLQALQRLQQELIDDQDVVQRAAKVTANSQNYQYQNQIINDLNSYAKRAGVSVTNIDFSTSTAPASNTAAPTQTSTPTPTGVKPATLSVSLKNPVNYKNLLNFMRSIEQNLTKMQIASVSLSQGDTGGVTSDVLNILVYIR